MVTARTSSSGDIDIRAGGSGPTAIAQNNIKSTTLAQKTIRLLNALIKRVELESIRASSRNVVLLRLNCERAFEYAGIGRSQVNVAFSLLPRFQPTRSS